MLFMIERYAIRTSSRFLRRCLSNNIGVQCTEDIRESMLQSDDNIPSEHRQSEKSLKIAILGAPNVGKSTLVNKLVKRTVCAASCKVHTTQAKADAIYSEGDTQLIFMDTPGMVTNNEFKKFKLNTSFKKDPKVSLEAADIVGVIQDTTNIYNRQNIHPDISELLKDTENKIPIILILNKVDKLKNKNLLLHLVNVLTKSKNSLNFSDVFMISALTGDGIDDLRTYLMESAKSRKWIYERHMYCNYTCEEILQQTVRAKLLDNLPEEIPYTLHTKLEHFDPGPDDSIVAVVSITCPTARIFHLLLRNKASRIKTIASMAEDELRHAFRTAVKLKLGLQIAKK